MTEPEKMYLAQKIEHLKKLATGFDHGFGKTNAAKGCEVGLMADEDFSPLFRVNADHYDKEWLEVGERLAAFYAFANPELILELIGWLESIASRHQKEIMARQKAEAAVCDKAGLQPHDLRPVLESLQDGNISVSKGIELVREWASGNSEFSIFRKSEAQSHG